MTYSRKPGTALTRRSCQQLDKPVCLIDSNRVPAKEGAEQALAFVVAHQIQRLNVAGPRASHCPEAYPYAYTLVARLLAAIRDEPKS